MDRGLLLPWGGFTDVCQSVDLSVKLTGEEKWPILGDLVSEEWGRRIIQEFKGLSRYGDCFQKAVIVSRFLGGVVAIGGMRVFSVGGDSCFGYDFNPPKECHCWVILGRGKIVDFALPGVIELGKGLEDEQGSFLVGRDEVILAGDCPKWARYAAKVLRFF